MTTDTTERDKLLASWECTKAILELAKVKEMEARKAVIACAFPEDAKVGTNRIDLANGYALKCVRKINYKLDNDIAKLNLAYAAIEALGNEGPYIAARILKRVYDFGAGEYKKLEAGNPTHDAAKKIIDAVLTTSDGAPTLEIEKPKEAKK